MDTYTPPQSAQSNARKVLEWRRKHGDAVRGMTPVGWARARQLASGKPVSRETVSRMSQFARHRQNAVIAPEYKDEPWRDNGHVAWLGWGGNAGIEWAQGIMREKEAGSTPTGVPAHGPGGLMSAPGMGGKVKNAMMKTEGDGQHAAGHYLVVEDDQKPSTWHLRVMGTDGKPDRRLMGAAWAALTVGYRGNKYQGPNRTEALMKLRRMYRSMGVPTPGSETEKAAFMVYKDRRGIDRWVSLSSNPYQDRDSEFVSLKALQDDVQRADADGDYGPLRFWHVPGVDIGKCDFNAMHGKMLLESGTFNTPEIAQRVKERAEQYGVSIAFAHPPDEPKAGVFHTIRRKERSLVPRRFVANTLTRFMVTEEDNQMDNRKVEALKELLGPDIAASILTAAANTEKAADTAGLAFKERSQEELAGMSADALLEYALAKKEAEEVAAKEAANQKPEMEDDDGMTGVVTKAVETAMKGYMEKMDGYMQKMAGLMEARSQKEANDALTQLQAQIASVQGQVEQWKTVAQKAMAEAEKAAQFMALPPAARGVRPTESPDNVTETGKAANGKNAFDDFAQFLVAQN